MSNDQYKDLTPTTLAAIDNLVHRCPGYCGRDLLGVVQQIGEQYQPNLPDAGTQAEMYMFLAHRQECGVDCDEMCPVSRRPCRN